jgi:C-terminal processing protease CtpA/Prc
VREVLEGSSADLDGRIRIDDEVVSVCGADVSNLSARQVTQLVTGEAGTRVSPRFRFRRVCVKRDC